jgi:hypothetical protein
MVTYDYRAKDGFLATNIMKYQELRSAFAFLKLLSCRTDLIGKPILERI